MRFYSVVLFAIFLFSLNAKAASYDCTLNNLNKVERLICEDEVLSNKDELLSDLYTLLPKNINSKQFQIRFTNLKSSQRDWLSLRNSCADKKCMILQYDFRISELRRNLLWMNRKTSNSYILNIIENIYPDSISKRSVEEIVFYSLIEGEYGEYLVRLNSSMGINGNYCGSGRVISYVYLKYDFVKGKVTNKKRLTSHDCGNSHNLLSHKVEMNYYGKQTITTFYDYLSSDDPKEAFQIIIGNVFTNDTYNIYEKDEYPKEPWG
jgi:uncharacterized protein